MLHYRIRGFQSEVFHLKAAMKTQWFANIWKVALAPFAPSNYVHGEGVGYPDNWLKKSGRRFV